MKKSLFMVASAMLATCALGQLKIDNATFFISSGATVTVQGDLTSNVDIQGPGLLQLKGTALQNVDMAGFLIPNLEIDNTSNVNFLSNAKIGTSLLLTNGKAILNAFDLRIEPGVTSIAGATSAKYIVTNGAGRLMKRALGNTAFVFPVGFSVTEYNPLTITNSGTVDTIGVRCLQNVLANGSSGSPVAADFANNSWVVTEAAAGGSVLAMTGQWNASDELADFNRVKAGIARFNTGTDWDLPASSIANASGSGPYTETRTNITNTGVFAVADLTKVNAARLNVKVFLQGAYNSGTGLMSDALRDDAATGPLDPVIPTTQPYSISLNPRFDRTGSVYDGSVTVNETINPTVFNVTGNDAIVDWVYVSTLDAATGATKLQTRAALLQRDGDIVDLDGFSPVAVPIDADGNYHFIISHRNHLSVRTPAAQALADNITATYPFTTALGQAYDNPAIATNDAMVPMGAVFAMWAGNANMDEYSRFIAQGFPPISSDAAYILGTVLSGNPSGTVTGYSVGDINFDRRVRATASGFPPIPSDNAFILGTVLSGLNNGTRREHK